MGIYISDKIFGIAIYNFDNEGFGNTLYEKQYNEIMSNEQMKEAYIFYNQLNDKRNISFRVYTECSSTLDLHVENFMQWYPISLNQFMEKFNV